MIFASDFSRVQVINPRKIVASSPCPSLFSAPLPRGPCGSTLLGSGPGISRLDRSAVAPRGEKQISDSPPRKGPFARRLFSKSGYNGKESRVIAHLGFPRKVSLVVSGQFDMRLFSQFPKAVVPAAVFFLPMVAAALLSAGEPVRYEYLQEKMAVPVRVVFYTENPDLAAVAQEAVYRRFDELNEIMSDYNPESEIVRACRESGETGEPVPIDDALYAVLAKSREMNRITGGTFDISVSPVVKLWRRSRIFGRRPPEKYLDRAKMLVGNENWELLEPGSLGEGEPRGALRVLKKDVRLDLGGIAKGYAIDEGIRILKEFGICAALIDAGGDIRVTAAPPDAEGWTIGGVSFSTEGKAAYHLTLVDAAIATSGDMFQHFEIDAVRYSHIIDPRNGEPLTRRSTVSILAPDATTADALASGISVLGPEQGVALAESLPGIEAIVITDPADCATSHASSPEGAPNQAETPQITASGRFIQCRSEMMKKEESVESP